MPKSPVVKDPTVSCYDCHSQDYDVYQHTVVPNYREMLDMVANAGQRYLGQMGPGLRVIDLGCGTGNASIAILNRIQAQVFLIDGSSKMVEIARKKIESAFPGALAGYKVCDLSESDWDCSLQPEGYHAAVSTLVLEHLPFESYRALLSKCRRLLVPGGWLMAVEGYIEDGSDMLEWFNQEMMAREAMLDPGISSYIAALREEKEVHYYTSKQQKVDWWREAGFENVSIIWQYLCLAMMVGRKSP